MTEQICVFLRGINVNGVKMKMEDLKKAFAGMGYPGAKTVLATGNVIIAADGDTLPALKSEIERGLSGAFHYDAHIFLRTAAELGTVLSLAEGLILPPDCHLYYLLCDDPNVVGALGDVFASLPHRRDEAFSPNPYGAFWIVPVGETLESAFGSKALGSKKYQDALTSRNMNTVQKIVKTM